MVFIKNGIADNFIEKQNPDSAFSNSNSTEEGLNFNYFPVGSSTTRVTPNALQSLYKTEFNRQIEGLNNETEYLFKINDNNNFEYKLTFKYYDTSLYFIAYNFEINLDNREFEDVIKKSNDISIYTSKNGKVFEYRDRKHNFTFHLVDQNNQLDFSSGQNLLLNLLNLN